MEYVQERIATLHDFGAPASGVDDLERRVRETAVVVPMTAREYERPAAERVLSELEGLSPAAVVVPVRAPPDRIGPFREWLASFALPTRVVWCNAPGLEGALADAGLDGRAGKGRDVWLALGPAADAGEYVVVHDADARSYEADHVRRLLAPLTMGYSFAKGYYARIEEGQLYGRLFRLLYEPLVRALTVDHEAPVLAYLDAFRYALAGEFALTASLARRLRAPRSWGLEVGTLGDAFDHAGFAGTAQVDLGRHVHDHRAVAGAEGLEGMSREVAATLCRVLEDRGVEPDYDRLSDRFRDAGEALIEQYGADARFNGLSYDAAGERDQLERYAAAIEPPGPDRRLPPWTEVALDSDAVLEAGRPWLDARVGSRTQD